MPRSNEQNEKIRSERRGRILKEALRQFATKGLFATKISDIAAASGMAQGLLYHYYKSKEEIYVELIGESLDKLNEAVWSLRDLSAPPHEKIRMAIDQMLLTIDTSDDFTQTCRLIAQATNSAAIPDEAREMIEAKRDIPYQEIGAIMAAGQAEGTILPGNPRDLSVIFWTSINGLSIYKATRPESAMMPDTQILYRMFLKENDYGTENNTISG